MNLFIDTNVLLSFYHLTDDDITELKKLVALSHSKKIVIWITSQLVDEFWRNRDAKIKDALKEFYAPSWRSKVPAFVKDYPEYEATNLSLKDASKSFNDLKSKIDSDITNEKLAADTLIADICRAAQHIDAKSEIFSKAIERMRRGSPPGKGGQTIGDEINWECLLHAIETGDIHIVSQDGDYASPLHRDKLHPSLAKEWKDKKKGSAYLHVRLSAFFGRYFKDIKVASELERKAAILRLAQTPNFARTHLAIGELSKFTEFTPDEVEDILQAAIENSQISMIAGDRDVAEFYQRIIGQYGEKVDPAAVEMFEEATRIWK